MLKATDCTVTIIRRGQEPIVLKGCSLSTMDLPRGPHRTRAGRLVVEDEQSCDHHEVWGHLEASNALHTRMTVTDGSIRFFRWGRERELGPHCWLPLYSA